ncbi:MAG: hypothetical protein IAG10_30755 [Planctomycetaceae bacterium]|nr:hypothetical protein [Planctomycetaceae bacterium]
MFRFAPIVAFCLSGSLIVADDTETVARQERLAAMRRRAEALQLKVGEKPDLRRVGKEPLFRYSDAVGTTTDGTLWLWTQAERPIAAACLFNDSREGFQWNYELVSLIDSALIVDGRPGWNWRPVANKRQWILATEPEPARSEPARLAQMKSLLSQFRAEEVNDVGLTQLRLLPRPVHRYRCPDEKIEDGAIFLFAGGTNPEVLVQVEVLSGADRSWRIGFARMTASDVKVARDEQTVWEVEGVREWNPRHEYFSHYGPDRGDVDQGKP